MIYLQNKMHNQYLKTEESSKIFFRKKWNRVVQIGDEVVQIGDGFLTSLIKFLLRFNHSIKLIWHVSDRIDVILVPRFPSGPDKVAPNKPNFHLFIWDF